MSVMNGELYDNDWDSISAEWIGDNSFISCAKNEHKMDELPFMLMPSSKWYLSMVGFDHSQRYRALSKEHLNFILGYIF